MLYSDQLTKSVTNLSTLTGEGKFQGEVVLKYSISYPTVELNRRLLPKAYINDSYLHFAQNARRYIINTFYGSACRLFLSMDPKDFSPLEIQCEMSVMYENNGFLSVFFDTYQRVGSNILKTMRHSDTWNLRIGKIMPIGCFFEMGYNFRPVFFREIAAKINEQMASGSGSYFSDWQAVLPHKLNFTNYYLADDGFVIFFPEYSIAPKANGLPSFLVPYPLFGSALKYDL